MAAPEDHRRGDGEMPFGREIFAHRLPLGFLYLLDDAPAGLDIGAASLRQAHLPGRAVDEPDLQMGLQVEELAADGRQRGPEPARSRRQAARLSDRDQYRHRVEAIHQSLPDFEKMLPAPQR